MRDENTTHFTTLSFLQIFPTHLPLDPGYHTTTTCVDAAARAAALESRLETFSVLICHFLYFRNAFFRSFSPRMCLFFKKTMGYE